MAYRDPLELIQEICNRRRQNQHSEGGKAEPGNVGVQLPLWPVHQRGAPNGVLRSALFGAVQKGARRYLARERIAALDGIEILYTGQRLDQGDLDVWLNVLHLARLQKVGEQCRFTAYQFLQLQGKSDTGGNRRVLQTRFDRLGANNVHVKQGRFIYSGSLIDEVYQDVETHGYVVVLNPTLRPLFGADQFTHVDWQVRHMLDGKPLAQWLHGFYSSHARPFPLKVATLHKLCGSEAKLRRFRQTMTDALDALSIACVAMGQPFSYEIRADLVDVKRTESKAQRRHLNKRSVDGRTKQVAKGKASTVTAGASIPSQQVQLPL